MDLVNLAVRFLVELVGVAFIGYWGFTASDNTFVRVLLGAGAVVVFVVIWGAFLAPNASSGLSTAQKNVLGTLVLLIAAGAFAAAGQPAAALVFAVVVLINAALLFVLGGAALESVAKIGRR